MPQSCDLRSDLLATPCGGCCAVVSAARRDHAMHLPPLLFYCAMSKHGLEEEPFKRRERVAGRDGSTN